MGHSGAQIVSSGPWLFERCEACLRQPKRDKHVIRRYPCLSAFAIRQARFFCHFQNSTRHKSSLHSTIPAAIIHHGLP